MSWWKFESWIQPAKPMVEPKQIEFVGGPFDGHSLMFRNPEPMLKLLVSAAVIDEDFSVADGDIDVTSIATYLLFSHENRLAYHFTGGRDPLPETDNRGN